MKTILNGVLRSLKFLVCYQIDLTLLFWLGLGLCRDSLLENDNFLTTDEVRVCNQSNVVAIKWSFPGII